MIIEVKNLTHIYNEGNPFEVLALENINFSVERGEFIGLIGHTGSGKSTLVQCLNGLIKASRGTIRIDGVDLSDEKTNMSKIRQKIGLVFQYPEYQLFEESIEKDIAFGPSNLNLNQEEIDKRVRNSMELVGLNHEEFKDQSPFELSGGQKRRVAIAGVLAMEPEILILDEPTAGLDPKGRDEILQEIKELYNKTEITIILVSHSMEDIARLTKRILVMDKGKLIIDGASREVFSREEELEAIGLSIPEVTKFMKLYKSLGHQVNDKILTVEEARDEIIRYLRGGRNV